MTVGVRFTKGSAKRIASVVRAVEAFPIDLTPQRRRVRAEAAGTSGIDMTNIDFGYVVTDVTARTTNINPGVFRHSQQHFTVLGAVDVEISTSPAYIYIEYTRGGAPLLMPPTNDLNTTIPDTDAYRHLLYTFTISSSGGLQDPTIHHLGGIFIGAYWA